MYMLTFPINLALKPREHDEDDDALDKFLNKYLRKEF